MKGAEVLVKTLLASGVDTVFANPGTSEMHFVAALDSHPEMHCVLCLFEGGVTGAADGYARMTGRPAATLLHLGPGFGNSWANLHNARKGASPVVNVVGDHAGYHLQYDAPLTADLDGVVASVSHWTRRAADAGSMAEDTAAAVRASRAKGGQIATLILPADSAWTESAAGPVAARPPAPLHRPDAARIAAAAEALKAPGAVLMLGGPALHGPLAETAGKIAAKTGCRLLSQFFCARIDRGEGAVAIDQMPYPVEAALAALGGTRHMVCVGEAPPVAFFAYPGLPSMTTPPEATIDRLCPPDWDIAWTLEEIARLLDAGAAEPPRLTRLLPDRPEGALDPDKTGRVLARHLPEGAIVVNEALTAGPGIWPHMDRAAAHSRVNNTGGSIGQALPTTIGVATACPDRPVFTVSGDGSAMYQLQSFWTLARETLDATVLIMANRGYRILHDELAHLGLPPAGKNASAMFDIANPALDWVALAAGQGVPGARAGTVAELEAALEQAARVEGPFLIEVVLLGG
ncbi:MAG: acetolactate synthase large subunit [Rhodobacterales bacterium]|nr:MAG: acetolactate synthase large subunit [Rhodobacterales bacterium]